MTDPAAHAARLARAMDGFLTTQLLYVAARLGIAGMLADGPRAGADVTRAAGVDPVALGRVLRGLAAEGVLEELGDGRFARTPFGETLPAFEGAIVARGALYYGAAAGLFDALQRGGTAFERVYGERFFDRLAHRPDDDAAFRASMAARPSARPATSSRPTTSPGSPASSTSAEGRASCSPRSCAAHRDSAAS